MRAHESTLAIADEELHDLKLRLDLLEGDRKAYYETSQFAIRQNKESITQLRAAVKDLGDRVVSLKKSENDPRSSRNSLVHVGKFEQKMREIHKRFDDLQMEVRKKADRLQGKRDRLEGLQKEAEMMREEVEESDSAYEIRKLENHLDKAMIKHGEAQTIRKTYEQMVRYLEEEKLLFDQQLTVAERTIKTKKADAGDLELMSGDANHARDLTKAEQARMEAQIAGEREARSKELHALKDLVKATMEQREAELKIAQPFDDATADALAAEAAAEKAVDDDREKRTHEYDETVRTIKEVMGVTNLDEVLAKFKGQKDTEAHLLVLQQANAKRFEDMKERFDTVSKEYDNVLFSGESRQTAGQRLISDLDQHLADATARMQEEEHRSERLAKLISSAKGGLQHALYKLEGVPVEDVPATIKLTDENIGEAINGLSRKLETLYKHVVTAHERAMASGQDLGADEGAEGRSEEAGGVPSIAFEGLQTAKTGEAPGLTTADAQTEAKKDESQPQKRDERVITSKEDLQPEEGEPSVLLGGPSPIVTVAQAAILPPNNCRVKLREPEFDLENVSDEEEEAADDHLPTREGMKKHATQLVNSKIKKPPKAKKKKKSETADAEE